MSQIGQHIRAVRQARGESQYVVARRADIPTTTFSRIENGHNEPRVETLARIAAALEVTLDDLVGPDVPAA